VVGRGSVGGTAFGGFLGLVVGAVPALGGATEALGYSVLFLSTPTSGYLGFRRRSEETEGVVYRAP